MSNKFPITSRYNNTPVLQYTSPEGESVPYLARRVVPPPLATSETGEEHQVMQQERLDNIAAQRLGDPQLSWLIADANNVLRPEELTETPGRTLRIPGGRIG